MEKATTAKNPQPLKNKWIVITRPKHQAKALRLTLEAAGAKVILFPLLAIVAPDNTETAQQQLNQIDQYDLLIFTSANAVSYSLKWLNKNKLKAVKVAAIGKKTAELLKQHAIPVDFFPSTIFNSEALLAMPEIQAYGTGKRIAIIRGQNGRKHLKQNMQKRGGMVSYINVYKRILPQTSAQSLKQHYQNKQLDIILITSGSSLINLFSFLPDNPWLNKVNLLLGSERIKTLMTEQYPKHKGKIYTAPDPSDETFYQQLKSLVRAENS